MNSKNEMSFEELRAISRGWTQKDWRSVNVPLRQVSANVPTAVLRPAKDTEHYFPKESAEPIDQKLPSNDGYENKAGKPRKMKMLEVKGETQTSKNRRLYACVVFVFRSFSN